MWALKMLREKNWRESLFCTGITIIHQIFPEFLQPLRDLGTCTTWVDKQRVAPIPLGFLLIWFCILVGLVNIKSPRSAINRSWHVHWSDVTHSSISSFPSLNFTYCRWRRRRAGRRWWGMTLLSWRCLWSWWRSRGRTWQAWNHNRNEVLRIAGYPNLVFNEMWFFDHWSIHKNIRFHRKAFRATILLACCWGLS